MVTFNPTDHVYSTEEGKQLISVTQLLKKHGLAPSFEGVPEAVLERAADRGTAIHAEFEEIIKSKGDCVVISEEANWFKDAFYRQDEGEWDSELMVWTEGDILAFAGTIDIVRRKPDGTVSLFDIKTGKVHSDAVAWQLSLYRYAYAQRTGTDIDSIDLFCIDAKPEETRVITVVPVKTEEIRRLLRFEADDIPYTPGDVMLSSASLAKVEEFETLLRAVDEHKRQIMEEYETFQNQLMNAMLDNGVKTFETPSYKVTLVPSSISKGFDSERFKSDHKDLYEEYRTKMTAKNAYLKVTEKKS